MSRLIAFFVDRSLLVNLLTVGVCVAGVIVATGLPRGLLPPEEVQSVEVFAELPGAPALDMERFVTFRLEEALQGTENVERITSTTTNGQVRIDVVREPGSDLTKLLENVRSRVTAIEYLLPEDLRPLRVREASRQNNQWLMNLLIENVDVSNEQHREAIRALEERLLRVPGVVAAGSSTPARDLNIDFRRTALERAGLSVADARMRLIDFFRQYPIGQLQVRDEKVAISLERPFEELEALRQLPLRVNRRGRGIRLSDVATVGYGFARETERETLGGEPYVNVWVSNAVGADAIDISSQVRALLAEVELPEPMTLRMGRDASELIAHEIATLQGNGLGGIALVLIILTAFLGWRVSAMTALGLPFCYCGMVLALWLFDVNFNLISLVAMILVVGILVDDAIIVAEEYCQQIAEGLAPREAAIAAVQRVGKPVLGMVATTTVAFLPLLLSQGNESWLIRPLPIVIISALFLSLFESFFLLPNHLRHFMRGGVELKERRPILALRRLYERALGLALKLRYVGVLVFVGLMALAFYLLATHVRFNPGLNLNARTAVYVELDEAAPSLDALAERVGMVEALIKRLPEGSVDHFTTRLGRAWTPGGSTVHGWKYAQIDIIPPGTFVEKEEKRYELAEALRPLLAELEETRPELRRLRIAEDVQGETRDVISVHVSGGDRIDFGELQEEIHRALGGVTGVLDVYMDETRFQRSFRFVPDGAKVLAYGLTTGSLTQQIREHFSEAELTRIRKEGEELEVHLGFTEEVEDDLRALARLTVITPRGVAVPLRLLGSWEQLDVLRRIEHRDLMRLFQVDVLYDAEQTTDAEVTEKLEAALEPVREAYPGYHVSVKPSEAVEEGKAWALRVVAICVGLIYLCLALALGSLVQPIIVLFAIPFGFVGVVLAFWAQGLSLGIMAVIGILGLAGVVVNDSLVMASTINDARGGTRALSAAEARAAIVAGASRRFRAVVLTSLTTLAGVFPLAYGLAGKAGWLEPMVMAVGWGLLFATVLTLFFMPCLLMILDDLQRLGARLWGAARRPPEPTEMSGEA